MHGKLHATFFPSSLFLLQPRDVLRVIRQQSQRRSFVEIEEPLTCEKRPAYRCHATRLRRFRVM